VAVTAGRTPRDRVAAECARRGRSAVLAACADLLEGREVDPAFVLVLGGPAAEHVFGGAEGGPHGS